MTRGAEISGDMVCRYGMIWQDFHASDHQEMNFSFRDGDTSARKGGRPMENQPSGRAHFYNNDTVP